MNSCLNRSPRSFTRSRPRWRAVPIAGYLALAGALTGRSASRPTCDLTTPAPAFPGPGCKPLAIHSPAGPRATTQPHPIPSSAGTASKGNDNPPARRSSFTKRWTTGSTAATTGTTSTCCGTLSIELLFPRSAYCEWERRIRLDSTRHSQSSFRRVDAGNWMWLQPRGSAVTRGSAKSTNGGHASPANTQITDTTMT